MIIFLVVILILIVSFLLAWRSLAERTDRVKSWQSIIFLKGREIFYSSEEKKVKKDNDEDVCDLSLME